MNTPYMIDWAITNRCNLDCLHCRGITKEELDSRTILRVAEEIPSLKPGWVIIEGGEPLLRKELFEIMEIIHKSNIKIYLISNGMLFNEDFAIRFAELNINLMISIDGADKESYEKIRRGASFEILKKSIAIANEYGILDSCPLTIGKHNYHQIGKLFQFAKKLGYKKITFLGLKPCKDYEKYVLNGEEYGDFFFSVIRNQKDYQMDVYVDEPFFKPFLKEHHIDYSSNPENGIIVPDVSHCIFGEYMFIETNGDIKPCTFAPVAMGNVNENCLNEIWKDMQNSELIKKIKDFSTREVPCRECKYLYECGGCRSRTFDLIGNWSGTDPSCPLKERVV
ncbi:MAG: radical SAM protein [Candidatus Celaenobacter polaris]|nr:radical SAM protein [Candidatus Celaenobacter polaris]